MSFGVIDLFNQLADNDYGFFQRINSISDIMTADVKKLTLDDTFEQTSALFRRHGIHHAPVIADDGDIVGVVSDRDLLRHRPPLLGTAAEGDNDQLALRSPASQFMTRGTIAVSSSDAPVSALALMLDHHVDCVLVYDANNELEGILTSRDFMKMVLLFHQVCTRGPDLVRFRLVDLDLKRGLPLDVIFSRGTRSVRDVMTKDVTVLSETDTIANAMDLMKSLKVRHLPVVDESTQLLGMVSDRDILEFLPLPVPRQELHRSREFREVLFAVQDDRTLQQRITIIMNTEPTVVRENGLFTDAVNVFMNQTTSGLPVLDHDHRLCGILTTTDVLRVFRITLQIGSLLDGDRGMGSDVEQPIGQS